MNISTDFLILAWSPGPQEMVIFLVIILFLFGSKKLPSLARAVGKSLTEFKKGKDEAMSEIKNAVDEAKEDDEA